MIVSKGVLKSKMLEYFRKVEETKEELIVTSNHVPVLKVIPIHSNKTKAWKDIFSNPNSISYKSLEDVFSSETDAWGEHSL